MRPAFVSEPKQHITATPGVCGGKPRIAGTRVRVWDIAARAQRGESPDEILTIFPHLNLADVHAALAHFCDNRNEIERDRLHDETIADEARNVSGLGPLTEKLTRSGSTEDKSVK